jgi:hypothetical protein
MKTPSPPFLEFGFYFSLPESEAFARLIGALLNQDAQFAGTGGAHLGASIRNERFGSIHEQDLQTVPISNLADFRRYLSDPDSRLVEVQMQEASGTTSEVVETVGYLSISQTAAVTDRHPLAISTEATLFSGPQDRERANAVGKRAYRRFRLLIEAANPSYAAITVEYALECPADLRRDPRSIAFRDFYVSEQYLGTDKLKVVEGLFNGAFVERIGEGLYISCNEAFNPKEIKKDSEEAAWQSVEVAKVIALGTTT